MVDNAWLNLPGWSYMVKISTVWAEKEELVWIWTTAESRDLNSHSCLIINFSNDCAKFTPFLSITVSYQDNRHIQPVSSTLCLVSSHDKLFKAGPESWCKFGSTLQVKITQSSQRSQAFILGKQRNLIKTNVFSFCLVHYITIHNTHQKPWPSLQLASKIFSLNFLFPEDSGPLRNTARVLTNAWKQDEAV